MNAEEGADPGAVETPAVTVIIPCRNEERFISRCLDSVVDNDFPKDRLEVLVVDGMSNDGTRALVQEYALRHPFIRLLDNPRRITPAALNVGIQRARGEVIIRLDAHAWYETGYISKSVRYLRESGADNVGGPMETLPQDPGVLGTAIAKALSHPFGVGNSHFRIRTSRTRWVDTVFGGCYRREVFERIGLFNEGLARGQDMEFNLRLKRAGGRTLLVPEILSHYYARSDFRSFWNHNWTNGVWALLPFRYSEVVPVSPRHLAPLAFLLALLVSLAFLPLSPAGPWMLLAVGGPYAIVNLAASGRIALGRRDLRHFAVMPVVFGTLHLAYGLGSLWGAILVLGHGLGGCSRVRRRRTSPGVKAPRAA